MAIPAEIQALATKVRNEVYGRDVREAIAKSIEETGKTAAEAYEITQNLIDGTFDEGILSTQIEQKLLDLEAQYAPQLTSLTADLADIAVNAKNYGLDENATWEVNRAALQQANDAVFALGGGCVLIPPGRYLVKGVIQDSRVEFSGKGVTFVHPDGQSQDIIKSRTFTTNGTITKGSSTLIVDDSSNFEVGSVVGVRGAGGLSTLQNTTLSTAIDSTQTTGITLSNPYGFANSGTLIVDEEVIEYTGMANGVLTGVTRGRFGSFASSHVEGAKIGIAMRLVAEVIAKNGNELTLNLPAKLGVTSVAVNTGILYPKIEGIEFDGRRVEGIATVGNAVTWELTRYGKFNFSAKNSNAALFLGKGTRDCSGFVQARDCGTWELGMGSAVWLFQHCHRNNIEANISGKLWSGVYLDDRTSLGTEWDGSCDDNIGNIHINADTYSPTFTTTGLLIIGSHRNNFTLHSKRVRIPLLIEDAQMNTADNSKPGATGNTVNVWAVEGYKPWIITTSGNVISGYYDTFLNGDIANGNLQLGVSSPLKNPSLGLFQDGSQLAPSIAFENDTRTGFYRIANGQIQYVSEGELVLRLIKEGILFRDGKNLSFVNTKIGSSKLDKMGFWGATPITQPSGTPPAANDLASALTLVNFLRTALQNSGLININ